MTYVTCKACKGKGYIHTQSVVCSYCKGDGAINTGKDWF